MRPLVLTVLIVLAGPVPAVAQAILPMPTQTFPEQGTFCGVLTLCPKPAPVQPET